MADVSLIKPLDQPTGTRRLLSELQTSLGDPRFTEFRLVVAYAKSGPILRLQPLLEKWRQDGRRLCAVIGMDQRCTSLQALDLAATIFDEVYVTREKGITFHPKFYLFTGAAAARCFVGSNNLTVGGTETNFEATICVSFELPAEAAGLAPFIEAWNTLLPNMCPATRLLDQAYLADLIASGDLVDESARTFRGPDAGASTVGKTRSGLLLRPASALPKKTFAASQTVTRSGKPGSPRRKAAIAPQGFAIQIKPHHNGEIFLSVIAALQNPSFFGWPFTGQTAPKKAGNPSYPQRDPDPTVNVTVYGAGPAPILVINEYRLNTVYYARNSEIRITASPLVGIVPDYSIMVMTRADQPNVDYDLEIHRPDSPDYAAWLAACNQAMPGGGQQPRKFGWF